MSTKMKTEPRLFAEEERDKKLSMLGDPLEKLYVIDWEIFRSTIENALERKDLSKGGRPPYDSILLFNILILQRLYNLSDDQTEFMINDRITFMRFLGLTMSDKVPDAKTIWLYRDTLSKKNTAEELFKKFDEQIQKSGLVTHEGTLIDATFAEAPRQRNTADENKAIKKGEIPEEWEKDDEKTKHKVCQKDTDAKWTKKRGETYFGYKNHVKVDSDSKLITDYSVTDAAVHDSKRFVGFIKKGEDKNVYADSAYKSKEMEEKVKEMGVEYNVCERPYRNKPLTKDQKERNRKLSKVRSRVEHVFGFMKGAMGGLKVRSIGIVRAKFNIGLSNLVYNMFRYSMLSAK